MLILPTTRSKVERRPPNPSVKNAWFRTPLPTYNDTKRSIVIRPIRAYMRTSRYQYLKNFGGYHEIYGD